MLDSPWPKLTCPWTRLQKSLVSQEEDTEEYIFYLYLLTTYPN